MDFMAFFVFFDVSPFHPFIYTLIFWFMIGIQEVHIWAKFHSCLICSSRVFKFQMFLYQQKVPFQAASRWFFGGNPLECGQICFKFCLPMQCKVMHQIFDSFYSISKKWSKLGEKKKRFSGSFLELFVYTLLHPMSYDPIFCQLKCLLEIHTMVSFISI